MLAEATEQFRTLDATPRLVLVRPEKRFERALSATPNRSPVSSGNTPSSGGAEQGHSGRTDSSNARVGVVGPGVCRSRSDRPGTDQVDLLPVNATGRN